MSEAPRTAFLSVSPDWVREVLSPSTGSLDRRDKLKVYAREGVTHVWLVDPLARTLEVLLPDGATYHHGRRFRCERNFVEEVPRRLAGSVVCTANPCFPLNGSRRFTGFRYPAWASEISLGTWGLLPGASALTGTGLAPAEEAQRVAALVTDCADPREASSRRTIPEEYHRKRRLMAGSSRSRTEVTSCSSRAAGRSRTTPCTSKAESPPFCTEGLRYFTIAINDFVIRSRNFVFDTCAAGSQLKCLTVMNEWTRECLSMEWFRTRTEVRALIQCLSAPLSR